MIKINNASNSPEEKRIFALVLAIIISYVIGYSITKIASFNDLSNQTDISIIINIFHKFVAPEPTERAIYISLVFSILPVSIVCIHLIKFITLSPINYYLCKLSNFIEFGIVCVSLTTLVGSDFSNCIFGKSINEDFHFLREYGACILVAIFYVIISNSNRITIHPFVTDLLVALIFIIIFSIEAFNIISWRILAIDDLVTDYKFSQHLDPIMYVLGQVSLGAKIFQNLPSQYGFYPQLLGFFFPKESVTLIHITWLFAAFQIFTIMCCAYLFYSLYQNKIIFAMTSMAFIMTTFGTSLYFTGITDPYFQYFPLRFLFPVISLCLFYYFLNKSSILIGTTYSIISVIAIFWNADSGLVVYLAFLGYLIFQIFFHLSCNDKAFKFYLNLLIFIFIHIAILAISLIIFELSYLKTLSEIVTISSIFNYQRVFYLLGFYMLPMPTRLHAWMVLIIIYIGAIIWGASPIDRGITSIRRSFAIYVGILGIGLFSYYQGRSHVLNLVSVSWPSLILLGLAADYLWSNKVWKTGNKHGLMAMLAIMAFLLLMDYRLISKTFTYRAVKSSTDKLVDTNIQKQRFRNQLDFLKGIVITESSCLLLMANQGIYSAELNIRAPNNGPSLIEMILTEDLEKLEAAIRAKQFSCIVLGISELSKPPNEIVKLEEILKYYRIDKTDFEHDLALLRAR